MLTYNLRTGKTIHLTFRYDDIEKNVAAIIHVDTGTEHLTFRGLSRCNPLDQFKKSTGRKIAIGRALDKNFFSKEERNEFWSKYFNEHRKDLK